VKSRRSSYIRLKTGDCPSGWLTIDRPRVSGGGLVSDLLGLPGLLAVGKVHARYVPSYAPSLLLSGANIGLHKGCRWPFACLVQAGQTAYACVK
jgi:hypothetical protein